MPSHAVQIWLTFWSLVVVIVLFLAERYLHIQTPQCRYRLAHPSAYAYKAGDIILSNAGLINRLVSRSVWGHVGMVYRDPVSSMLYVWDTRIPLEGTLSTLTTSIRKQACRLTPLYRYLRKARHPIALRALNREVDVCKFAEWVRHKWDQPFDFSFLSSGANRVFQGMITMPLAEKNYQSGQYCAELIAETLGHLGVLNFRHIAATDMKPQHAIPKDFSQSDERLNWAPGWSFGPEILIAS